MNYNYFIILLTFKGFSEKKKIAFRRGFDARDEKDAKNYIGDFLMYYYDEISEKYVDDIIENIKKVTKGKKDKIKDEVLGFKYKIERVHMIGGDYI